MNERIHAYLDTVTRHSGLSRRERAEWREEMAAHVQDEVARLTADGYAPDEAVTDALAKFGRPSELRRTIARETFGFSVPAIVTGFAACFTLFLVNCGLLVFLVRSGAQSAYVPNVPDMLRALPMSPTLMLSLSLCALALLKTRRRKDRFALLSVPAVYGLVWVAIRLPLPYQLNGLVFGFKGLSVLEPSVSLDTGILVLWGLVLYGWTKNGWLAVFPTILSLGAGVWSPLLWTIASRPWMEPGFLLLSGAVRCIPIALLLPLFALVQRRNAARRSGSQPS